MTGSSLSATGEIEVSVDGKPIDRLGPGAGVGEIRCCRRSPRTATVVAITDVTGYGIEYADVPGGRRRSGRLGRDGAHGRGEPGAGELG